MKYDTHNSNLTKIFSKNIGYNRNCITFLFVLINK